MGDGCHRRLRLLRGLAGTHTSRSGDLELDFGGGNGPGLGSASACESVTNPPQGVDRGSRFPGGLGPACGVWLAHITNEPVPLEGHRN